MKISFQTLCLALCAVAQPSSQSAANIRRNVETGATVSTASASSVNPLAAPSASGLIQVEQSSNKTLNGWYAFVDPKNGNSGGVAVQFVSSKSKATVFSLDTTDFYSPLLAGFKAGYVAGSTNAEGTAAGGTIFMSLRDQYVQGGEPLAHYAINNKTNALTLSDQLGDGVVRNISQACNIAGSVGSINKALPVWVVGEKNFHTDSCASLMLYWRPSS